MDERGRVQSYRDLTPQVLVGIVVMAVGGIVLGSAALNQIGFEWYHWDNVVFGSSPTIAKVTIGLLLVGAGLGIAKHGQRRARKRARRGP